MAQEPESPRDTREFVAGWQSIVEEHVVGDLAGALNKLVASEPQGMAGVARHVAHALQVAASPTGSLQAAIRYLCDAADQGGKPGGP